jgi:segregation and condensation protein A
MPQQEYEVKLELFEGPLDLLLYLVSKAEVAIIDISVAEIAKQYIEYLDLMRDLNINIAAEYLYMASTLVRLKAQELLPSGDAEVIETEDGIYNRQQLIEKLLEYKKFKEAAGSLKHYEAVQFGSYTRGMADEIEVPSSGDTTEEIVGDITIFDLVTAFKRILDRVKEVGYQQVVQLDNVRIDDRIEHVLGLIRERGGEIPFNELFTDDTRKIVIVVTFMALLELIKMQEVSFRQDKHFDTIYVLRKQKKSQHLHISSANADETEPTETPSTESGEK